MEIEIQPSHIRLGMLLVVVAALVAACSYGFFAGRDLARSELVVGQTRSVVRALNYFAADQDRYPGETEFADPGVMRTYLSTVPITHVPSQECPKPFAYETFDRKSFTIVFCLPRDFAVWAAGSHSTTEKDIATW